MIGILDLAAMVGSLVHLVLVICGIKVTMSFFGGCLVPTIASTLILNKIPRGVFFIIMKRKIETVLWRDRYFKVRFISLFIGFAISFIDIIVMAIKYWPHEVF